MPQESGVVSNRIIGGVNREIMYLDRITNAYCDHNVASLRQRTGSRTNMMIQCTGIPQKASAFSFLNNNNIIDNTFYLDVQDLRNHLNQLWSEYKFNILQEYDQTDPRYIVDENKWLTNRNILETLVDTHNGGNWNPIHFRMIGCHIDPASPGTTDAHFARDRSGVAGAAAIPRTDVAKDKACWRAFQQIALSELSIPYLVKMDVNVFHLKFEILDSATLLTAPPPTPLPVAADKPRNWLWLGAPGTGKSFQIMEDAAQFVIQNGGAIDDDIFKMTFHPSTSYSDFIGDYRPLTLYDTSTTPTYVGLDTNPNTRPGEISIDYSFVPGTFLKAFIRALENPNLKIVVIVDEINRGNIFDIMGEVLHLMDREQNTNVGSNLVDLTEPAMTYLRASSRNFREVRLPENLYLWATMNPNDHSVHRIDSAFVRRWTIKYIGINNNSFQNRFTVPSPINTDWDIFRRQINRNLEENGFDEAEMIGFWYLEESEFAEWETFYSKLVFHLANNVVKHNLSCLFETNLNSVKQIMDACSRNENPFNSRIAAAQITPPAPAAPTENAPAENVPAGNEPAENAPAENEQPAPEQINQNDPSLFDFE